MFASPADLYRRVVKMTIYRREASRGGKRNSRWAKFPSLSRKRNSFKGLPPIYEIDEDCGEEVSFVDAKDNKYSLLARRLSGNIDHGGRYLRINTKLPDEEKRETQNLTHQKQRCGEFQVEHRQGTWSYLQRNLNSPVRLNEGNSQTVFPDFFPPGMHVHCAQNALPEASKGLYMKIMQGENELQYERNICKTNKTTDAGNNPSYKQQNWMQFFG